MARVDNRGNLRGSAANSGASVRGADDFLALSRRLKAVGETELRKELHRAMGAAAKPLIPKVKDAARRNLPRQGGLNERIAKKPLRAQTRTGAKTAGVRIVGTKVDPRINEGRIFHPVFGRPGSGVVQQVPRARGYFDETLSREGPAVRDDILKVIRDYTIRALKMGL